jgi:tRNA pseudouridine38-40 synthase
LKGCRQAAALLLGEHDFSAFRAAECQAKSRLSTCIVLTSGSKEMLIVFTLKASAFLHHMVRNIVGSLVFVGTGKREPEWIAATIVE